ncbi:DUF3110 domain-containing protein [Thermodesulfobacteriota bacterium]
MDKTMDSNGGEGWLWVVVSDKETDRHYLGLYDEEQEVNFIPAFESKEEANDCFLQLPREKGKKYEVQAVHIEELTKDAEKAGFSVAIVNGDGKIVK